MKDPWNYSPSYRYRLLQSRTYGRVWLPLPTDLVTQLFLFLRHEFIVTDETRTVLFNNRGDSL